MKLALASDHAGFELKSAIAGYLKRRGIAFEDLGCGPGEAVDYVDSAARAAERVAAGARDRAILFCGTGIGMAIAALENANVENRKRRARHVPTE
jgi:ribose 5-phosphate isomerase B